MAARRRKYRSVAEQAEIDARLQESFERNQHASDEARWDALVRAMTEIAAAWASDCPADESEAPRR